MKNAGLLVGCLIVASCAPQAHEKCITSEPFPYTSPYNIGGCPADIQSWMDRVNSCGGRGEKRSDQNRCDAIGCDYQALFSRYEGDIVYTGILTGYAEQVYGSVENIPHCTKE